jgi:hypothetical protein
MATPAAPLSASQRWSLSELTVRDAWRDLLDVEPVDLGPGAPASAALALERGSHPGSALGD